MGQRKEPADGSMCADERQTQQDKTVLRKVAPQFLLDFAFAARKMAVQAPWQDYQNNHKGHDHQNNLSMEDSQDERAKGRQSSFLKVLTVLNNSHFFSLSFLKRDCKY